MIGVVDIGNTRTKWAVYRENGEMLLHGVAPSLTEETFFRAAKDLQNLKSAVIGSVVPSLIAPWQDLLASCSSSNVYVIQAISPWGFRIDVEHPETVGVDRLLNLEGALRFPGAVLVVDAGTATKFDVLEGIDSRRSFPGGAIAPGFTLSYEALLEKTAQLPRIDLDKFSPVVGYNTETAIRSGVVHGFAALVDGMILKIFEERKLSSITAVVATGGASRFLLGRSRFVTQIREHLTLEGLYSMARKL